MVRGVWKEEERKSMTKKDVMREDEGSKALLLILESFSGYSLYFVIRHLLKREFE